MKLYNVLAIAVLVSTASAPLVHAGTKPVYCGYAPASALQATGIRIYADVPVDTITPENQYAAHYIMETETLSLWRRTVIGVEQGTLKSRPAQFVNMDGYKLFRIDDQTFLDMGPSYNVGSQQPISMYPLTKYYGREKVAADVFTVGNLDEIGFCDEER